jgi:hypothetical protein
VAARFPKPAFALQRERFDPAVPRGVLIYILGQFALLLCMTTHFLSLAGRAPWPTLLAYAVYLAGSLCVLGALLEGRRGAWLPEALRVLLTAVLPWISGRWFGVPALPTSMAIIFLLVFCASALSLPWLGLKAGVPEGDRPVSGF